MSSALVNDANAFDFRSSTGAKRDRHQQSSDARRVVDMIDGAIPVASNMRDIGYDVVGMSVVHFRNDGSPVTLVDDPAMAPITRDRLQYDRMVRNICSEFRARFKR